MDLGPFDLQYVLLNGSVKGLRLWRNETGAFIFAQYLRNPVVVSCQLFADEGGVEKIGSLITERETVLTDDESYATGKVRGIRCMGT